MKISITTMETTTTMLMEERRMDDSAAGAGGDDGGGGSASAPSLPLRRLLVLLVGSILLLAPSAAAADAAAATAAVPAGGAGTGGGKRRNPNKRARSRSLVGPAATSTTGVAGHMKPAAQAPVEGSGLATTSPEKPAISPKEMTLDNLYGLRPALDAGKLDPEKILNTIEGIMVGRKVDKGEEWKAPAASQEEANSLADSYFRADNGGEDGDENGDEMVDAEVEEGSGELGDEVVEETVIEDHVLLLFEYEIDAGEDEETIEEELFGRVTPFDDGQNETECVGLCSFVVLSSVEIKEEAEVEEGGEMEKEMEDGERAVGGSILSKTASLFKRTLGFVDEGTRDDDRDLRARDKVKDVLRRKRKKGAKMIRNRKQFTRQMKNLRRRKSLVSAD